MGSGVGRIDLAHEPDFQLGALSVRPSLGEVGSAAVGVTRLEPRVMQVLVALVRASGAVVSRDALVADCWHGVAVSENAIDRAIGKVRRLSERPDAGFRVESLPRIGVRLLSEGAPNPPAPTLDRPAALRARAVATSRRTWLALGLGGAAMTTWAVVGRGSRPVPVVGAADPGATDGRADHPVDDGTRELYLRALQALEQPARAPIEQAVAYLQEAVRRSPRFALGWAALAEAQRHRMLYSPPPLQPPERAAARRSAERALMLDPGLGQVYGTIASLAPRFNRWGDVDRLFRRGLALSPDHPLLNHQYAQFLMAVGRTTAAATRLTSLHEKQPLNAAVAVDHANALLDAGREREALSAITAAQELWPGLPLAFSERVRFHIIAGEYDRAAALLDDPPSSVPSRNIERRRLLLDAVRGRRPETVDAAVRHYLDFRDEGTYPGMVGVLALSTLGRPDLAMAVADRVYNRHAAEADGAGVNMYGAYTLAGEADPAWLFRRDATPIRSLSGFAPLLQNIGLTDFWRHSGTKPDFRIDQ